MRDGYFLIVLYDGMKHKNYKINAASSVLVWQVRLVVSAVYKYSR